MTSPHTLAFRDLLKQHNHQLQQNPGLREIIANAFRNGGALSSNNQHSTDMVLNGSEVVAVYNPRAQPDINAYLVKQDAERVATPQLEYGRVCCIGSEVHSPGTSGTIRRHLILHGATESVIADELDISHRGMCGSAHVILFDPKRPVVVPNSELTFTDLYTDMLRFSVKKYVDHYIHVDDARAQGHKGVMHAVR